MIARNLSLSMVRSFCCQADRQKSWFRFTSCERSYASNASLNTSQFADPAKSGCSVKSKSDLNTKIRSTLYAIIKRSTEGLTSSFCQPWLPEWKKKNLHIIQDSIWNPLYEEVGQPQDRNRRWNRCCCSGDQLDELRDPIDIWGPTKEELKHNSTFLMQFTHTLWRWIPLEHLERDTTSVAWSHRYLGSACIITGFSVSVIFQDSLTWSPFLKFQQLTISLWTWARHSRSNFFPTPGADPESAR